jgi:hypothetical protein
LAAGDASVRCWLFLPILLRQAARRRAENSVTTTGGVAAAVVARPIFGRTSPQIRG